MNIFATSNRGVFDTFRVDAFGCTSLGIIPYNFVANLPVWGVGVFIAYSKEFTIL